MNGKGIAEAYREFQQDRSQETEEFLTHEIYRNVMAWLQNGYPEERFLHELMEISASYEEPSFRGGNLLELSLWELMEVVHAFNGIPEDREHIQYFLTQARLPLLARIDEDTYRVLSQLEFHEVDFFIYETIGGEFPHDSAQAFLKNGENPDIWLSIRYLDDLEDDSVVIEIIESMIDHLRVVPEKYMILAYLIYRFPERIEAMIRGEDGGLRLSNDTPIELAQSIYVTSRDFIATGILTLDYREKMIPGRKAETMFALLSLFEITQCELNPAWIDVMEQSMANLWTYRLQGMRRIQRHQPLPEFVASILSVLTPEEVEHLLVYSRVLAIFFENLHRYTRNTFEELLDVLSHRQDLFLDELELQLSLENEGNSMPLRSRRLTLCARSLGKQIVKQDGRYYLVEGQNL